MTKKKIMIIISTLFSILVLAGCSWFTGEKDLLDPKKPTTITIWHYYNGQIKDKFDALVAEFNETIGMQRGIVVDAQSHSDVQQLANAVFDAANKTLGAHPMPDIFAAYPENAYRVNQIVELVELESYFTETELQSFRQDFLEEGRFTEDDKIKIIPIAKSTENLYLNKTDWEVFANATGANLNDLRTWEGIVATAQRYYEYSGKGFMGIDATANYMLLTAIQLSNINDDKNFYNSKTNTINFNQVVAKTIWDHYYIPYIEGYFVKTGRFSSDDARTGTVLAYTGSSAGAAYFPKEITISQQEIHPVDSLVLPYPHFQSGIPYAIQQGAGMCITKSDKAHEYAAALFLKWFTEPEQNVEFAVTTAYFPVKNDALKEEVILRALEGTEVANEAIKGSINTTMKMLDTHTFFSNKPFEGSYEIRVLLENHLNQRIKNDLEALQKREQKGEDRKLIINSLSSEEQFQSWYKQFMMEANSIFTR
ncbi:sugar ABC transporter substrate-binding protein [Desulfuribacillus stibiiarsenatis]|uniref:Sugar ABC transporter substrate-binding protein n=1 Tax=Desulfuribacillus stibiiarsenatis TaxID=1390249 RepID=A0A1E5L938_9FIRM|nr:extracellular solute-binding protein [Desulfuribacillus stibiiarsenatis]OEH86544.1 sugar ABC transporter substrate-binding protein [Desulfuribacillus stibiiarsenatis]